MFAIAAIITSMVLGVIGQVCIKKGLNTLGYIDFSSGLISSYSKVFLSHYVMGGISLYGLGVFFWLYALSKVELSIAYPFFSLSYVLVMLLSWGFLGESISPLRWVGVATICLGVFLISRS